MMPVNGEIPSDQPVAEMTWWEIWKMALFQPSEANYQLLAKQARYKKYSFVFILLTALAVCAVYFLAMTFSSAISSSVMSQYENLEGVDPAVIAAMGMVCMIPLLLALVIGGFYLWSGFNFLVSRLFKGIGTWEEIVFLFTAVFFPITVVSVVLQMIPIVQYLAYGLSAYNLVLNTIAIKTVNRFPWIKAILITVIIPLIIFGTLCACFVFAIVVPMYPQILEAMQEAGSSYTY
jgi:hypothetical protein